MCSETVGVAPVSWWMTAQSSSLSKMSRGSPGPGKRAKRVPPVPTPQEGTATSKAATFSLIAVDVDAAAGELLAQRVVVALERRSASAFSASIRSGSDLGHERS